MTLLLPQFAHERWDFTGNTWACCLLVNVYIYKKQVIMRVEDVGHNINHSCFDDFTVSCTIQFEAAYLCNHYIC